MHLFLVNGVKTCQQSFSKSFLYFIVYEYLLTIRTRTYEYTIYLKHSAYYVFGYEYTVYSVVLMLYEYLMRT